MKIAILIISVLFLSCNTSKETIKREATVFDLAHNAQREQITMEVLSTLPLYSFLLEINDPQTNRRSIQSSWRTQELRDSSLNNTIQIRDRAILNITPRGKSSVYVNVYAMVNAEIEFEIEKKSSRESQWKKGAPTKEMEDHYKKLVRDIRNRMLRYDNEF